MNVNLFGRSEITTSTYDITEQNVVEEVTKALEVHTINAEEIDYLWRYVRGDQPILTRKKQIRPEICNKVAENHALEIASFTAGYFLGEPLTYVHRGTRDGASDDIETLNSFMYYEDKSTHDKNLATWMAVCGVGYRMVLPDADGFDTPDDAPFEIDIPDPRTTFVVYHSGFGKRPVMGVREITKTIDGVDHLILCGYTRNHYFEIENSMLTAWRPHSLGMVPIFEYTLNMYRMGSFEPALSVLDGINTILSNRIDGVEQYIQSFLKFKNCDVDDSQINRLHELGAIAFKTSPGLDGDIQLVAQELNQQQTQTLVDYLYDQVLSICGLPTSTKGGSSTSDTGAAVLLRDGWEQTETRARDTEMLFKRSEKEFLKLVLRILREVRGFDISLSEVECKFTRRQHDNLLTKTQSLLHMLEAGIAPEISIATCGLFNDPSDVSERSAEYLKKWDYVDMTTEPDEGMSDDESV